jgi:hypothetical protein
VPFESRFELPIFSNLKLNRANWMLYNYHTIKINFKINKGFYIYIYKSKTNYYYYNLFQLYLLKYNIFLSHFLLEDFFFFKKKKKLNKEMVQRKNPKIIKRDLKNGLKTN